MLLQGQTSAKEVAPLSGILQQQIWKKGKVYNINKN